MCYNEKRSKKVSDFLFAAFVFSLVRYMAYRSDFQILFRGIRRFSLHKPQHRCGEGVCPSAEKLHIFIKREKIFKARAKVSENSKSISFRIKIKKSEKIFAKGIYFSSEMV